MSNCRKQLLLLWLWKSEKVRNSEFWRAPLLSSLVLGLKSRPFWTGCGCRGLGTAGWRTWPEGTGLELVWGVFEVSATDWALYLWLCLLLLWPQSPCCALCWQSLIMSPLAKESCLQGPVPKAKKDGFGASETTVGNGQKWPTCSSKPICQNRTNHISLWILSRNHNITISPVIQAGELRGMLDSFPNPYVSSVKSCWLYFLEIYSFTKYLLSTYCVPGTVLDTGDIQIKITIHMDLQSRSEGRGLDEKQRNE